MRKHPHNLPPARFLTLFLGLLAGPTLAQNVNGNGQQVAGTRPPAEVPTPGQPWEQRTPYGKGQKPAVAGQTRAGAVLTKTSALVKSLVQKSHLRC